MKTGRFICFVFVLASNLVSGPAFGQFPRFKVLAFYSTTVEPAHVTFASDAIRFFEDLTIGDGFVFDTTSSMEDLNETTLKDYSLILMLNDFPHTEAQRQAMQRYLESGGGWLGFHVAAYNDADTHWPWLLEFLGGGVFYRNNWPPLPARLEIENKNHPVTRGLPASFVAPSNEWYQWKPSPRANPDVEVLVSLSPDNYPLGLKDILPDGDVPVVWTNKRYRMVYLNMGHGDRIFSDATQNKLIVSAFRWLLERDPKGDPFQK